LDASAQRQNWKICRRRVQRDFQKIKAKTVEFVLSPQHELLGELEKQSKGIFDYGINVDMKIDALQTTSSNDLKSEKIKLEPSNN